MDEFIANELEAVEAVYLEEIVSFSSSLSSSLRVLPYGDKVFTQCTLTIHHPAAGSADSDTLSLEVSEVKAYT